MAVGLYSTVHKWDEVVLTPKERPSRAVLAPDLRTFSLLWLPVTSPSVVAGF